MSHSIDSQTNPIIHNNNNNKTKTKPLSLSLLTGLNNNNNKSNNKCISDSDFVRSPKSPLEHMMMLSTMARSSHNTHLNCCCVPNKVGLSIVDDSLFVDDRGVVFGPALRIKLSEIRSKQPKSLKTENGRSSGVVFEIGETEPIRSRNHSHDCLRKTLSGLVYEEDEMEMMSEDYTCVITHGPNPKTTHIYGDRVLECQKNESKGDYYNKEMNIETEIHSCNFLSFCYFCNKKLEIGEDIYMYRGDKAFCSEECRLEEMMIDEEHLKDSCKNL